MNESHSPPTVEDIDVLQYVRATILVIDRVGVILQAHGGTGRPLSYRPEDLVGHNALEFIAAEDHEAMAEMFMDSDDLPIVATPQPFPLRITGADGITRVWDCVPSGFSLAARDGWVVTMTCRQEQAVAIDAMECFLQGGTALEIAEVVANRSNNEGDDGWRKKALVVYRPAGTSTSPFPMWQVLPQDADSESAVADALASCLEDARAPWNRLAPGTTESNSELPPALQAAAEAVGLPYCTTLAVGHDDETLIVFLRFSNFPRDLQGNNQLADHAVDEVLQRAIGAEQARSKLDQVMRVDPLTGISNRLHFDEVVTANDRSPHAALFVDIDNFKSVNDTFGHATGDAALREVAERIVRSCRPQDLVARVGGDEFAVILRDVTNEEAEQIAARIRGLMAERLTIDDGPETISVTVGIATPTPGLSLAELVRRADHAMLEGKHSTRETFG